MPSIQFTFARSDAYVPKLIQLIFNAYRWAIDWLQILPFLFFFGGILPLQSLSCDK